MLSPYRIPPSSNTHTTKQKTSNRTEYDRKVTLYDLKMTPNDLKMTSNEPVKRKKNKLKGSTTDDNPIHGRDLIEQAFSST